MIPAKFEQNNQNSSGIKKKIDRFAVLGALAGRGASRRGSLFS